MTLDGNPIHNIAQNVAQILLSKYRSSKKVFTIFLDEHCHKPLLQSLFVLKTIWITNSDSPPKFSRTLKLTRLQERLHTPGLDHKTAIYRKLCFCVPDTRKTDSYRDSPSVPSAYYCGLLPVFYLTDFQTVLVHKSSYTDRPQSHFYWPALLSLIFFYVCILSNSCKSVCSVKSIAENPQSSAKMLKSIYMKF